MFWKFAYLFSLAESETKLSFQILFQSRLCPTDSCLCSYERKGPAGVVVMD